MKTTAIQRLMEFFRLAKIRRNEDLKSLKPAKTEKENGARMSWEEESEIL